ncbi:AAA family ATPase [Acetobacterium paludosum]|uniref:AAA family ATPase n=1 Tax=Acetobacterium paludosum TaxID=52693 RepID=A0A923KVB6_9FIRM|nr:AAA family ATPase [Acetobacterium paludosum]MBC3887315.1 AAA family ATPase [Acetobacterium paludosum]
MKIKTLNLKAFGKFKNKTIDFKPGLNLIYGNNEAGKTTVQTFIQGMFFGFYKPYRKKKTYSTEYEKYLPWKQFDYSGSLIYEVDDREIRLERNFLRGKDSLKIFDNITGEDISDEFKYDGVIRQHLPLGKLGMTSGIYNNTINMRQLSSDTESGAQDEMRDSYLEMQNTSGIEMNFKGIAQWLEEKKKNIGRSGQSKSRVGAAIRERDELLLVLKEAEEAYAKVAENQEKITLYQKQMKRIEAENDYLTQESVVNRKKELLESYEKITELEKENSLLAEKIEVGEGYKDFNYKNLEGLKAIRGQSERFSDQMDYIEKQVSDSRENLKNIRKKEEAKRLTMGGHTWERINEDYDAFKKQQHCADEVKNKSNIVISVVSVILTLLGIGLTEMSFLSLLPIKQSLENSLLIFGLLLIVGGVIGSVFGVAETIKKRKIKQARILKPVQHDILKKYGVKDLESFETFYKKAARTQNELEQMKNEGELITVQLSRHQAGYEVLFEQRRSIMKELDNKLALYDVDSVEDYADGCEKAQRLEEMKIQFNGNLRLLKNLLETVNGGKTAGGNVVWKKASPKSDELLSLGKEIARLEGENSALTDGVGLPVEIRETIKSLDAQIDICDIEIKACNAVLEILGKIQKGCHLESAPELNDHIGGILEDITQRYKGVKIDEAMKVRVVNPSDGDFKNAEQLSAGTMDQVHFAFRYGMGDVINHEMPFILDEPFVRYDKLRKTQALKLLAGLSKKRQVILFTCDDDEENRLKALGATYHKIRL